MQRRSPLKKIGGGQWDLSVAEHLSPGESYAQGAQRGLREELGIEVGVDALAGPLAPTHRRELRVGAYHDCELVQSYRLDGYGGEVRFDDGEVCDAAWVALGELRRRAAAEPECYTQWLREEGEALGWFDAAAAAAASVAGHEAASAAAAATLAPA